MVSVPHSTATPTGQLHGLSEPGLVRVALLSALLVAGLCGGRWPDEDSTELPFTIGERLTYQVSVEKAGKVGKATMWIEGPITVRGTRTYLLRFDSRIKVAFVSGVSRSSSWFDPRRGSSLRYFKHERNPLTHHDESVDMYPDEKRWTGAAGLTGTSPDNLPLDELSFMYFIRTLPLTPGAVHSFDRHFDVARNPIAVRMVRREIIPTPMGELRTFLVEMRVRDPRHYKGEGVIRIHLTDDACRIPARIQSQMPILGTAVLTIDSQNTRCGGTQTNTPGLPKT
jgi:hypothetical protein